MKPLHSFLVLSMLSSGAAFAADPDFGPHVFILDPQRADAQEKLNTVYKEQEAAQFGKSRYAFLFKPGKYNLDAPIGFYTQMAGLGASPDDVTIAGKGVWTDAAWMRHNATCNFWRTVENLAVEPASGSNMWAVSQAAPMRRTHIKGDISLSSGGWSSGGFFADCKVDGKVNAGSQQQWFSRNSSWKDWTGVNWNMVFVGCVNPPAGQWPRPAITKIEQTPLVRNKPFLAIENEKWVVKVPALIREPSSGVSWDKPVTAPAPAAAAAPAGAGTVVPVSAPAAKVADAKAGVPVKIEANPAAAHSIPIEQFHIAKVGTDTAATINAALKAGKNLIITPGIYEFDDTIVVTRPNTIVLGLGLPSLMPATGKTVLRVEATEGVMIAGMIVDGSPKEAEVLVEIGVPGRKAGKAENPTVVQDLVCRTGGYGEGRAKLMVAIHNDHVIGENFWLWRADHGAKVGWTDNTCETGLRVEGDDVTIYGLFVEHTQKYQTIWNGERGRTYFYQSEMPYDPPVQDQWMSSPTGNGYASYKVGDKVKTHEAWGVGVYHVFRRPAIIADNAIETPTAPGVKIRHAFSYRLGGGKGDSGIRNVLNGQGGDTFTKTKATID